MIVGFVVGALVVGAIAALVLVRWLVYGMYDSIGAEAPTADMLRDESSALFRHLPFLRTQLAWRPLGVFPTPVHTARLPGSGRAFWLKREDLASPLYGGNKVRTLQHQLAALEVHVAAHPEAAVLCVGSAGSNQVVAATVHGTGLGVRVQPCYLKPDAPELDNTLNFLSTLSFGPPRVHFWRHKAAMLRALAAAVASGVDKVFFMGGNSVLGVLGQMGAALELAEQIQAGDMPDVDEIYVPVGSGCTLTGLVLGIVLARHLGLHAFRRPGLKVVAVPIHPASASLSRRLAFYVSPWSSFVPLTPRFGFGRVAAFLRRRGLDVDLEPLAVAFLSTHVDVIADADLVGRYGAHSARSAAAAAFDAHLEVDGDLPSWAQGDGRPWLCGHFVAKPFAVLLERLEASGDDGVVRLLWQTKSSVQPRGPVDEWAHFEELTAACPVLRKWADNGRPTSVLRRGHVHTTKDSRATYRPLMTKAAL
ncbi:hypothetical protein ACHHYP_10481 [Achlya hypogyna]|uniref:Tryptophan synthase beta chain-like PALP domain-containing protein n=1 Tax=Achlya hypogyna TaxID=1202772 RepID=A0A1V9YLC7_ACHHY|nr:hypothetical protein ACHHYP_10481 [Achlya hypogyna]